MSNQVSSWVRRHSLLRMTLHTEVNINASSRRIWEVLATFSDYQYWNPSIPDAQGEARVGSILRVEIQWPGLRRSPYKLEVLCATPERELRWLGHLGRAGVMDGNHSFIIEPMGEQVTKVIQAEHFSGWLVPLFAPWLTKNVLRGFEEMNEALKKRAEGCNK